MSDPKKLFHQLSYLQYPIMLLALFYCYRPLFGNLEMIWVDMNKGLVFLGLGISFSTLQDTTKTQNKISKRIFENPQYSRRFIIFVGFLILFFLSFGLFGLFFSQNKSMQEIAFGMISLAIGIVGMLKASVEMAANHQLKNDSQPL